MGGGEGHSQPEGPSPPAEDANTESPRPRADRREDAFRERGDWIPDAYPLDPPPERDAPPRSSLPSSEPGLLARLEEEEADRDDFTRARRPIGTGASGVQGRSHSMTASAVPIRWTGSLSIIASTTRQKASLTPGANFWIGAGVSVNCRRALS